MKPHILFTCIAIVAFPLMAAGQTITLAGKVTGADNDPIPGVNIYTRKPLQGTTTNADSAFSFTFRKQNITYVYFSAIGYHTDSIRLTEQTKGLRVKLKPDLYSLSDVVIMPDSTLRALLRKAYNRIPANYPVTPVRYDGFYRETARGEAGEYLYFSEAILDVYKNGYNHPRDPGQVKIVKSRRNILPEKDSIFSNLYFYGGAFASIDEDFVLKRVNYINPAKFKHFNYSLTGVNKYEGRDVYVVEIASRKTDTASFTARLYIDSESLAYIRLEFDKGKFRLAGDYFARIERLSCSAIVNYTCYQDKWYLKSYQDEELIRRTTNDKLFKMSSEFVTTRVRTDSVKSIPYKEQLAYGDPFLLKTTDYDPGFWDGYTILEQDQALNARINLLASGQEATATLSKQTKQATPKWVDFLLRLYSGLGVVYQPVSSIAGDYHFNYVPSGNSQGLILEQNYKKQEMGIGIVTNMGFYLTKNWSLFWSAAGNAPFTKGILFSNNQLGAGYRINIKPKGRPLFLGGSFSYGWSSYYAELGQLKHSLGTFKAGGKTIDAGELDIRAGFKQTSFYPGISIAKSISNLWELELTVKYQLQLTKHSVVGMKEKEGFFLFRKTATLPGDAVQVIPGNGANGDKYITVAPFQAGLILKLR